MSLNPRPPRRGRPVVVAIEIGFNGVSIRAPREGGDSDTLTSSIPEGNSP